MQGIIGRITNAVVVALTLCVTTATHGQGPNTVCIFEAGLNRVDFLSESGAVVAFANLIGSPTVGARSATGTLWVATDTPSRLAELSVTGSVGVNVPLPDTPSGIAIDDSGNIWVSQLNTSQVHVYNSGGTFLGAFTVGAGPRGISIDAAGAVWVANSLGGSVSRITSGLVFTFPTGGAPFDLVASQSGGVWVSNLITNSVQRLSAAGTVIDTVAVGLSPIGVALDEQDRLWVASSGAGQVTLVPNSSSDPVVFSVGANPRGVSIDGDGRAWVACQGSSEVYRIDPHLGTTAVFAGFSQPTSAGDVSGLARARLVDPLGDVDGDSVPNGAELTHRCNPFDPTLPEIGRVTPERSSVEGGSPCTIEGCGFLSLVAPELFLSDQPVTGLTVVDDHHLTAVIAGGVVTATPGPTRLVDSGVDQDVLAQSFRFYNNPGQAWLPGGGNNWNVIPIAGDGSRGPAQTTPVSFAAQSIAVDAFGGAWFVNSGGDVVERRTADGILTDSFSAVGRVLGAIAVDPDGNAWVVDSGTDMTPGDSVLRFERGSGGPSEVVFTGTRPIAVAVSRTDEVWVANEQSNSISRIRDNGSSVVNIALASSPTAIAIDRRERAWATTADGMIHELDTDGGVLNSSFVGADPAGIAVAANDTIWITLASSASVARFDPTSQSVTATYPTAPNPQAIAIDGGDAVWVLHAGSGEIRRFAVNGILLDSFSSGVGDLASGDFLGVIPVFFHAPTDDHDGDGACSGAELQSAGEPFHPDRLPANDLYFEGIDPNNDVMVGGATFTMLGCALDSGGLTVLIGGNPVTDLVISNSTSATGTIPASFNNGSVDIVVTAAAGSSIAPAAFTYRTSPISSLTCEQNGVPLHVEWIEDQAYDSVIVERQGVQIATVPGGVGSYIDSNPPLGSVEYAAIGVFSGESGDAVSCTATIVLSPPTTINCAGLGDAIELSWTNNDDYDNIVIERDGFPLTTLPGTAESFSDTLPALGDHDYEVFATRGAFSSESLFCTATFEVLSPTSLVCTPDFGSVLLEWTSVQPYGFVRVFRDSSLLIELAGDPGSYTDMTADEGPHDYDVVGVLQGTGSPPTSCAATVPVPGVTLLTCSSYIFDVTLSWQIELPNYDLIRILRDGSEVAVLPGNATTYDEVGLPLGTYDYDVIAERNATAALAANCSLDVIGPIFIRGDVNADQNVDIGDPVAVLSYLFGGGSEPTCLDAADINDDGNVNVADAVYDLTYLFSSGAPPPPPFDAPGADPTADTLDCAVSLPEP